MAARGILAHFLADMQDDLDDEIAWDEVSLAESAKVSDDELRAIHPDMHLASFMSSLHLNLADGYRRLGRIEAAGRHLESSLVGDGARTGDRPEDVAYRHWATACRRGDRGAGQLDACGAEVDGFARKLCPVVEVADLPVSGGQRHQLVDRLFGSVVTADFARDVQRCWHPLELDRLVR